MTRGLSRRFPLAVLLALLPATVRAETQVITFDCGGAAISDHGGWQAPGQSIPSADSACEPDGAFILWSNYDAYYGWIPLTPEIADITIETEVLLAERDGAETDAFSLLLHWSGSTDLDACCEPAHADSGLRLLFSLARGRMEVYQETAGASSGPLATLPFSLPAETPRSLKVGYRGTTLDLTVDGVVLGAVTVPATPPGLFGFDARGLLIQVAPVRLTIGCAADADCDGAPDGVDNCPTTSPADQTDTDHDGLGNLCDSDDDGDGIADAVDVCPLDPDPLQEDADQDQVGDACDVCPADPTNDADDDRICGQIDNCPFEPNPGQENIDTDSSGDACDFDDGYILVQWTDAATLRWQRDVNYDAFHVYRRNVADLRATGAYVLDPELPPGPLDQRSCDLPAGAAWNDPVQPGEAVAYFFSGSFDGLEGTLGTDSAGDERPNPYPCATGHPFEQILYDYHGPATPLTLVIDNRADWCAFRPSACNTPLIDFATHVAVVVGDGSKSDSCHDIRVTGISGGSASGEVVVSYEVTRYLPPLPCGCLFVIISPLEVVKTPRPVTSASFIRIPRTIVPPCP